VDRTIVEVSSFGIKLTYPHTSLGVRPARNRQFTTKRIPHVEPSATHTKVWGRSAWSPSRSRHRRPHLPGGHTRRLGEQPVADNRPV